MDASYESPAVANRIHDVQCFSIIHVAVRDSLAKQVDRIVHRAYAQAAQGKVICAIIVSHEAAPEFLGEIYPFRFPCMCRRRVTTLIKADLEEDNLPELFGFGGR